MIWQTLLDVDKQLLLALNGDGGPFWDSFFYVVSAKLTWVPLYVLLLYCIWRRLGWRGLLWSVVILGVSVGLADQICNFFKHYTPKFRPTHTPDIEMWVHTVKDYRGGLYGTVSAHAAISFTIAVYTALLFRRWWYTVLIVGWALLMAYSRIYLGVHFPMDICLGTILGIAMGVGAYRLFMWRMRKGSGPGKLPDKS